jgi:cyclomaltodextrinase
MTPKRALVAIFFAFVVIATSSFEARANGIKPGAVIYGVVPPLFGFRPIRSVTERLDYLRDLGVDYIWLAPITETDDPSQISYAVTDHFKIREDYGTDDEFRTLVREAHKRGIGVMIDFIANHTSTGSRFFQQAQSGGPRSQYWRFYERDSNGKPKYYFNWENLPNLNFAHPQVAAMIESAMEYWADKFGVDGFRMDAAWGVRERSPEFWGRAIRKLRSRHPNLIMVAESSARDPYYIRNGFDFAYDWTRELGEWSWKLAFSSSKNFAHNLDQAIHATADPNTVVRYINNNDTGKRFITRFGPRVTKVAAVLQHTVPGVTVLFTGDEMGLEYEPYNENPPLKWKDKFGIRPLYKKLAQLREALPALQRGNFESMFSTSDLAYGYMRKTGKLWTIVLLNFGSQTQQSFSLPDSVHDTKSQQTQLHDAITGKTVDVRIDDGKLGVTMEPFSALILVP